MCIVLNIYINFQNKLLLCILFPTKLLMYIFCIVKHHIVSLKAPHSKSKTGMRYDWEH